MHPAFERAGRKTGLEIWRIENFEPMPYPKKDYGMFYRGDSYIILNTKTTKAGVQSWHIHYWLGSETTPDEAGSAAILTVQLDDQLNGLPIQHREVENHESEQFLAYFKEGIRYKNGGIVSGFQNVRINDAGHKRLFQVKGNRNVRVREVELSITAMNTGDCFILDGGAEIYVYIGPQSRRGEKMKAIRAANQIRDQDHNGRAKINIVDEYSDKGEWTEYFEVLGSGSPDTVPDGSEDDDDSFEKNQVKEINLYMVSNAGGEMEITTVSDKPLKQQMLISEECFILETGSAIYVWVGRGSEPEEKSQAMQFGLDFIKSKNYPSWVQVQRIVEGGEPAPFKQYFSEWKDIDSKYYRLFLVATDNDSDTSQDVEFDASTLHALKKSGGRALGFMPDNGDGELEGLWRIENFDLAPVDPDTYGTFYGGDSYVLKYHYANKRGGQGYVIYYWQGNESSIDEKAASALHAVRLDDELGGSAIQVRAVQSHEPRHFLKIFKGRLIICRGGHGSGFKNVQQIDDNDNEVYHLFRIRGTGDDDVRADEMILAASSLASDDVFVLKTSNICFIWHGKGGSNFEKEMASNIAARISPNIESKTIKEDSEPVEFWNILGGKGDYDRELDPPGAPFLDPRLFHCRILYSGKLRVEEISDFVQDDLNVDDIMVLDGGDEIYVWIGDGSTDEEKEKSIEMANLYIRTDPSDRSELTVPIIKIHQSHEPRSFKRLFPAWDDQLWTK